MINLGMVADTFETARTRQRFGEIDAAILERSPKRCRARATAGIEPGVLIDP